MINTNTTEQFSNKLILHVAPDGCDGWSGLQAKSNTNGTDGPLATLKGAKEKVCEIRKSGRLKGPVDILVHAGIYELKETLRFGPEDMGDAETPVKFKSAGDGESVITGGVVLKGFEPYKDGALKLDLAAAGFRGLKFSSLSFNGLRQIMSRYPKFDKGNPYGGGWLYIDGPVVDMYQEGHGKRDRFICRDQKLKQWSNINEVEVFVFPRYNWINDIIPIKSYDCDTGEVILERPCTYELYPGDRLYFRNLREEVTQPGEWYLDRWKEILYFYPPKTMTESDYVTVPLIGNIIKIQGPGMPRVGLNPEEVDWDDVDGKEWAAEKHGYECKTGYLEFNGLTFDGAGCSAAIIKDAAACKITGCIIRNTGGAGIVVLGGKDCHVEDNDIYETGSHGVHISGGMRSQYNGTYISCGHVVENNYIHHMGNTNKSVAGISLNGVGIRASHNYIHDGPRWGILSRGNDNVIEYNHIRHVNIETSDTAAIYLCDRDFSMYGTKIRYNSIHDILGYHCENGVWRSPAYAFGIYLDDWTSGVEVYGNLIYRTPSAGVNIHSGKDNVINNNMIIDTRDEIACFGRIGTDQEYRFLGTRNDGLTYNDFTNNIVVTRSKTAFVYHTANMKDVDGRFNTRNSQWNRNLIWTYGEPLKARLDEYKEIPWFTEVDFKVLVDLGFDTESIFADPLLNDLDGDDFSLQAESPAFILGFKPLPVSEMGLFDSGKRASWPVVEAEGAREKPLTVRKK